MHADSPAARKVAFFSALFAAQPEGPPLLAVATASYVGEGFDCPPLNDLFLAAPVAFRGRLVQHAGRMLPSSPRRSTAECTPATPSRPAWSPPPRPNARLHHPSGSRS